jgi:hypothetical protein
METLRLRKAKFIGEHSIFWCASVLTPLYHSRKTHILLFQEFASIPVKEAQ